MPLLATGVCSLWAGCWSLAFFVRAEEHCLSIASAGGQVFLFTGQRKTLEEARRLLTDKINTGDDSAVYRINFAKGIINAAGHFEPPGAVPPSPGALVRSRRPGPARLGGLDLPMPAMSPPVPLLATVTTRAPTPTSTMRSCCRRSSTCSASMRSGPTRRTSPSGSTSWNSSCARARPPPAGRARLGQLAGELGSILGAYPHVVHIFQQAARLAGA